jgi:hypothetical protein
MKDLGYPALYTLLVVTAGVIPLSCKYPGGEGQLLVLDQAFFQWAQEKLEATKRP